MLTRNQVLPSKSNSIYNKIAHVRTKNFWHDDDNQTADRSAAVLSHRWPFKVRRRHRP